MTLNDAQVSKLHWIVAYLSGVSDGCQDELISQAIDRARDKIQEILGIEKEDSET